MTINPDQLRALAGPAPTSPARANGNGHHGANGSSPGSFDLAEWVGRHLAVISGPDQWNSSGIRWEIECPFNADHADGAAWVGRKEADGPIGAGCHHNGCSGPDKWGWRELRARFDPRPEPSDGDKPEKKSASTTLVEIGQALYDLGVSDSGEAFGVPRTGPKVVHMLRGGRASLRRHLAREFFAQTGRAATQQALSDALMVLDGLAETQEPTTLHLRVAKVDGAFWLDMGDQTGRVIRVSSDGWTVEDVCPVLFRRTELTGALPVPEAGGDLAELWQFLNIDPEDRPLVLAALIGALVPSIPHPAVGWFGEHGTGKSTAQKIFVRLVDPGPVPSRKAPKDADSWVTAAAGSWVVGLENLSSIPDWLSDSICRAVTGDGDVRRRLYTDGDLSVFSFRRVVSVNGIDVGAVRGDLADRLLPINLRRIPDEHRLEEEDLWPRFEAAHPRVLGAVLDAACEVFRLLPSVEMGSKPRMADWARILGAVDQLLGTGGLARYAGKQRSAAVEALTADPFILRLEETLTGAFEGTARDLLDLATPTSDTWRTPKGWPASARAVTQLLHRQGPVMRLDGWTVEDRGVSPDNRVRATVWRIARPGVTDEVPPDPSSRSSQSSPDPGQRWTEGTVGTGVERQERQERQDPDLPRPSTLPVSGECDACGRHRAGLIDGLCPWCHAAEDDGYFFGVRESEQERYDGQHSPPEW